jgi:hypothetical protein
LPYVQKPCFLLVQKLAMPNIAVKKSASGDRLLDHNFVGHASAEDYLCILYVYNDSAAVPVAKDRNPDVGQKAHRGEALLKVATGIDTYERDGSAGSDFR